MVRRQTSQIKRGKVVPLRNAASSSHPFACKQAGRPWRTIPFMVIDFVSRGALAHGEGQ